MWKALNQSTTSNDTGAVIKTIFSSVNVTHGGWLVFFVTINQQLRTVSAVAMVGSRRMYGSGLVCLSSAYLYTLPHAGTRRGGVFTVPLSRQVQSRDSEPAATKTGTGPLNENLEPLEGFSHHLGGFLCTRWKVRSPELPWLTNVRKRAGLISEIVSGKRVVWLCVTKEIDNQDLQLPFLHHPWPRFVISKQINKNLTSTCVRDLQILFGFLAIRNHASKDTRGCDCTQSRWPFKSLNLISCQNQKLFTRHFCSDTVHFSN